MLRSVPDWVKSPFSVFTGSPADACDTPGAAGFDVPPAVVPAGTSPPVEGASAWVAELTGGAEQDIGLSLGSVRRREISGRVDARRRKPTGVNIAGQESNTSSTGHAGDGPTPCPANCW